MANRGLAEDATSSRARRKWWRLVDEVVAAAVKAVMLGKRRDGVIGGGLCKIARLGAAVVQFGREDLAIEQPIGHNH